MIEPTKGSFYSLPLPDSLRLDVLETKQKNYKKKKIVSFASFLKQLRYPLCWFSFLQMAKSLDLPIYQLYNEKSKG